MNSAFPTLAMVLVGAVTAASLGLLWGRARKGRLALVPLAVVLASLALLAFLAGVRARALGVEACAAELERLGSAVELYGQSNDGQAPPSLEVLVPFYFEKLPRCPSAVEPGSPNPYAQGYQVQGGAFTILCRGARHEGPGGASGDSPSYTSEAGLRTSP